ncbi:MAG: hypothetical protein WCZ12_02980 [Patescibacteria group bacterium]
MEKIINLNEGVLKALKFLSDQKLPKLNLEKLKFPLVVGSGNAYNTAQIIFSNQKAVIASESNFKEVIESYKDFIKKGIIKEVVVISASGEKDSVWEIELAKKYKLKTILLTCSKDSSASKIADEVYVFPKIAEPYTYNISTYLGMILAYTKEKPENILSHIKKIKFFNNFNKFKSYSFVLPDEFTFITQMLDIKKSELFGPLLSVRAFSFGEARHAKFVIRDKNELVITLGKEKNKYFGEEKSRWQVSLPNKASFATIMALTYYIVGKIQESKPQYFKKHIQNYCHDYGPKAYGKKGKFNIIG